AAWASPSTAPLPITWRAIATSCWRRSATAGCRSPSERPRPPARIAYDPPHSSERPLMKRSVVFAIVFAAAAALWVASGQLEGSGAEPQVQKPPADLTALAQAPLVRVRASTARSHAVIDLLRGRTEASRLVEIRSETEARIIELAVDD